MYDDAADKESPLPNVSKNINNLVELDELCNNFGKDSFALITNDTNNNNIKCIYYIIISEKSKG